MVRKKHICLLKFFIELYKLNRNDNLKVKDDNLSSLLIERRLL